MSFFSKKLNIIRKKQLNDIDCHCHGDIILEEKHADIDTYYRETLAGILKSCELGE